MKFAFRLLVLAALLGTGFSVQAQKGKKGEKVALPEFPMKGEKVMYTGVEEVGGTSAELYKKTLAWFNSYYKNPTSVIKSKDEEAFTITGKHRFNTYMTDAKTGAQSRGPMCFYTIKVMCKDGRYKYDIIDLTEKGATAVPVEKMVMDQRVSYQPARGEHLVQMHEHCLAVAYALKKHMAAGAAEKEADW